MSFDSVTLRCFLAVADSGSFTRAAEQVGRTQSAVSQQMGRLEQLLGKPLLERKRSMTLTADGELFLGYARRIYALQREALDRFSEPELAGDVRFGVPEDFAAVFLSDVLVEFARSHPRILLNIECDLTLNLFQRFREREFDLVLVKMSRPEDFPNGLEIWSEPLEWVGDESLLLRDQPTPLVLSPQPCVYRARALATLERAGRPWRHAFSSVSYAGTIAAVKAGMGLTVLPRNMVPADCNIVSSALLPPLHDIHVSMLKHEVGNSAIESFENYVLERVR